MKHLIMPWTLLMPIGGHSLRCLETHLDKDGYKGLAVILISLVVFWHIYTPIHELLHVAACYLTGGTVQELYLQPQYGGTLLKPLFPFIVSGGEYAGRLSGFTYPCYWSYALIDFFPYILSVLGVAVLEYSRVKRRAFLLGPGVVLAFVPIMAVTGDYYEAVSLITTQIAELADPSMAVGALISDDMFRSFGELQRSDHLNAMNLTLMTVGFLTACYLAMITLAVQVLLANRLFRRNILEQPTPTPVNS